MVSSLQRSGKLAWDINDLQGPDLMDRMKKHAEKYGVNIINDYIKSVEFNQSPFLLVGEQSSYNADAVIIATGASAIPWVSF